jgi:hypothetical protein
MSAVVQPQSGMDRRRRAPRDAVVRRPRHQDVALEISAGRRSHVASHTATQVPAPSVSTRGLRAAVRAVIAFGLSGTGTELERRAHGGGTAQGREQDEGEARETRGTREYPSMGDPPFRDVWLLASPSLE